MVMIGIIVVFWLLILMFSRFFMKDFNGVQGFGLWEYGFVRYEKFYKGDFGYGGNVFIFFVIGFFGGVEGLFLQCLCLFGVEWLFEFQDFEEE